MSGIRQSNKCLLCDEYDDVNDQTQCLGCVNGSNFKNDALNDEDTNWDAIKETHEIIVCECEICEKERECAEFVGEGYRVWICRHCLEVD